MGASHISTRLIGNTGMYACCQLNGTNIDCKASIQDDNFLNELLNNKTFLSNKRELNTFKKTGTSKCSNNWVKSLSSSLISHGLRTNVEAATKKYLSHCFNNKELIFFSLKEITIIKLKVITYQMHLGFFVEKSALPLLISSLISNFDQGQGIRIRTIVW